MKTIGFVVLMILLIVPTGGSVAYWWFVAKRYESAVRNWADKYYGISISKNLQRRWWGDDYWKLDSPADDASFVKHLQVGFICFLYFMSAFILWMAVGIFMFFVLWMIGKGMKTDGP